MHPLVLSASIQPAHTYQLNHAFQIKHHHGLNSSSVTTIITASRQRVIRLLNIHFHCYQRAGTAHRNTTVRTGPYTAVRVGYASTPRTKRDARAI
jgi:hypothetical protein